MHLPVDLVNKICNLLVHLRRINGDLKKQICNQDHILDKIWYNNLSLFGLVDSWYITYHDLHTYIVHHDIPIERDDTKEYTNEHLCRSMWALLEPDERKGVITWAMG